MKTVCLAGGVGGAKLCEGFYRVLSPGALTVVVNTGDDFRLHGLFISPDLDTVTYGLSGLRDRDRGWGLRDETFRCHAMLERLGAEGWFLLGDQDLAIHLRRTQLLAGGSRLTEAARSLTRALGVRATVLPMCDEAVETQVRTEDGEWLDFQDYFVRRGHRDPVVEVRFRGQGRITGEVRSALDEAELLVACPSNPFVSIDPILQVSGIRQRLGELKCPRVGVSPIVGGEALKGPAGAMLRSLGHEPSALGVARLYLGWLDLFVLDERDQALVADVERLGMRCFALPTVMGDERDAARLAERILELAS
ncbi:MAG: 2-phospho-L-lactate transferase [Armatimonadetes bacterium]|nr:2-phospho-L-lactate transferase [Armatimonadota bacterium]